MQSWGDMVIMMAPSRIGWSIKKVRKEKETQFLGLVMSGMRLEPICRSSFQVPHPSSSLSSIERSESAFNVQPRRQSMTSLQP
jgi:hypothetical protein